jgi:VWFA-related protein
MKRALAVFLVILGGTLLAGAQSPAQQSPAPIVRQPDPYTLSVTAREVVFDVVVTDAAGHSVKALKASDFSLSEDGVPQTVLSLTEHSAMTPEALARLAPPQRLPANLFTSFQPQGNTNAVTVVLIDALDTPLDAQMYLREEMLQFMKTLPAGNVFAIFQLDASMHLVQGFTSDPQALLKALRSKRDLPSLNTLRGPGPAHYYAAQRKQLLNEGLRLMGSYLAAVPGRKNLIWFTGAVPHAALGLKGNPFPDSIDYNNQIEQAANVQSLSEVAIYPIDARGVSICCSNGESHDQMDEVAARTGGEAYHDTNGLTDALREITATSSNYYTLAYAPTNPDWNAHHRSIELSVNAPGLTLLYRHGYYARKERKPQRLADAREVQAAYNPAAASTSGQSAPTAPDAPTLKTPPASTTLLEDAMQLGAVPSGELLFNVSITPADKPERLKKSDALPQDDFMSADFRNKPFRRLQLSYAVDPQRLALLPSSDGMRHGRLKYVALVYTPRGELVNSLATETTVSIHSDAYERIVQMRKGIGITQEIAVPQKGIYFLRIGVYDEVGDLVGTTEVPVDAIQSGVAGPAPALEPAGS